MKTRIIILSLLITISIHAENQHISINLLQKTTKELISLENQSSQENINWQQQKQKLKQNINLLTNKLSTLKNQVETKTSQNKETIKQISEKTKQLKSNQAQLKEISSLLPEIESNIFTLIKIIPQSLKKQIKQYSQQLKKPDSTLSHRFTNIILILTEIENLQTSIIRKNEIIEINNQKKEFNVIYIGLSYAFCVSKDNKISGYGEFSAKGFKWKWNNKIAKKLRKAINILTKQEIATLVHLPLKINKNESPPISASIKTKELK